MIQNGIYRIDTSEAVKIAQKAGNSGDMLLLELQGKEIQSWEDYINVLDEVIRFPTSCLVWGYGVNRYHDWMRDLDWLEKEGYVIIIHDYGRFLEREPVVKKQIMDDFSDLILPWWQADVENCVVEGKAKPFNVYLVD